MPYSIQGGLYVSEKKTGQRSRLCRSLRVSSLAASCPRHLKLRSLIWVAVMELKLSYHNGYKSGINIYIYIYRVNNKASPV